MTKLDLIKRGTSLIVGVGVTTVVHAVCQNNAQPQKIADKVTVGAAGIVLAMMVCDVTRVYTDNKIQSIADWYDENVKK